MAGPPDRTPVRLAELVAALSLGIDLGFGQPMEHVLRQCLIATRLAERIGLDDPDRAGVYYTALLINVGCHTDAHEQAKWFGDDIDLKANKYLYEPKSFREIVAVVRRFGAGRPPLRRIRTGVEFATKRTSRPRGHGRPARRWPGCWPRSSACPARHATVSAPRYEQWDGKGWPGEMAGDDIPIAARIACSRSTSRSRIGSMASTRRARSRDAAGWHQFDPALADHLDADAADILGGLDAMGPGRPSSTPSRR